MILADTSTIIRKRNNPNYFSLGASGAISGILFSFILFFPFQNISILFIPIPIPAPIFAILYIAFSIYASHRNHDFINHDAHLWGAVAGLLITIIFFPDIALFFLDHVRSWVSHYL
jgi:membrane associated rhomboid family serine protease